MEAVVLDLNKLIPGKPDRETLGNQLATHDFQQYSGKRVCLRGCAPTWAHLMVAAKVIPLAGAVDFLIDDGKDGIIVPIVNT